MENDLSRQSWATGIRRGIQLMRLGIDLGGSKIEIVALDADGQIRWRNRVPTPSGDYMATLMVMTGLVEEAEQNLGVRATVGIGIPGTEADGTGLIKNANSTCLIGKPLKRDLQALLQRQVRIANDANCFALSEATDGTGTDAKVVFGVILGTGVGGGIVVRGTSLSGANGIAGEWGHNPLCGESAGRKCYCGRLDCVEVYLSGPGMMTDHRQQTGEVRSPTDIVVGAADGDADCEFTLQRYEARLARGLAQVVNLLDPDVIVLGGGLSNIDRLYTNVPQRWLEHIFSDSVATRLVKNRHGDSSGVRGAAWLWPDK